MNSDRLFADDLTIEELEEMWKQGWEIDINDGRVSKARLMVKKATDEGFRGILFW